MRDLEDLACWRAKGVEFREDFRFQSSEDVRESLF